MMGTAWDKEWRAAIMGGTASDGNSDGKDKSKGGNIRKDRQIMVVMMNELQ